MFLVAIFLELHASFRTLSKESRIDYTQETHVAISQLVCHFFLWGGGGSSYDAVAVRGQSAFVDWVCNVYYVVLFSVIFWSIGYMVQSFYKVKLATCRWKKYCHRHSQHEKVSVHVGVGVHKMKFFPVYTHRQCCIMSMQLWGTRVAFLFF